MFNKPHVLSFLALPLYPYGREPETDTMPPPARCNFACVLCAHVCVAGSTFLSLAVGLAGETCAELHRAI